VGDPVTFTMEYEASRPRTGVEVAIVIRGPLGEPLAHLSSIFDGQMFKTSSTTDSVMCSVPELPLTPGQYSVDLFASAGHEVLDFVTNAAPFEVFHSNYLRHGNLPDSTRGGHLVLRQTWSHSEEPSLLAEQLR
jgi:hypothetical protein